MTMSLLDFWDIGRPAAKRLKRTVSPLRKVSDREAHEESERALLTSRFDVRDVSPALDRDFSTDDAGDDSLAAVAGSQTELETSLPPVKMDKDAIEEYEASRAAAESENGEEEKVGLQRRLGERKWRKGKSSIYVDAFNLALDTVLDEEAHLFDEAEMEVFRQWKELSYESQYLYVLSDLI